MWTKPEIEKIIINTTSIILFIINNQILGLQLVFQFQKLGNCLQTFSDIFVPNHQAHQW